jgi:hypothetical protein
MNYNSLDRRALRTPAIRPGHWSKPVTRLSQLGQAQPMWAELGPAQKNKKTEKEIKVERNNK